MSRRRWSFGFLIVMVFSLLFGGKALAFYCGGRLVSEGDSKAEVEAKCGEPASKETRSKGEEWVYDFGPRSLVRILTFRGGRLIGTETGGYGSGPNAAADFGCDQSIVSIGDTKTEVQMKCGKPTSKEIIKEKRRGEKKAHRLEEWTYDLGPSRLMRLYRFEKERLVAIETGEYGK